MNVARIERRGSRVITAAIHSGHELVPGFERLAALCEADRTREEDPFTQSLGDIGVTSILTPYSRFGLDLNRPRDGAVYLSPEDAWGLECWTEAPPDDRLSAALALYDAFYDEVFGLLAETIEALGSFVVLDIHSYNHRRLGPDAPPAEALANPEVNLGTATLDRSRWAPVCDAFLTVMREHGFDTRENVKFGGGEFARAINARHPSRGCVLSVEFKKTFMDEWTGVPDVVQVEARAAALHECIPALERALDEVIA